MHLTPDPGYRIQNVMVDGTSQGSISTYRLTDAQVSHEIIASFTPDTKTRNIRNLLIWAIVVGLSITALFAVKRGNKRKYNQ